jgi:hypothetical protein
MAGVPGTEWRPGAIARIQSLVGSAQYRWKILPPFLFMV